MLRDTTFHDYVIYDLFGEMPGITSKGMFGGWALYRDGIIFGLIVDGELYFKVDDTNQSYFLELDSRPFSYTRGDGKKISMSYWLVPEEVMDNRERLYNLADMSAEIGRRADKRGKRKIT